MKVNTFLSEIIRGEWALNIESIQNYYPIVVSALEGKSFGLSQIGKEPIEKSIISYIDPVSKRILDRRETSNQDSIAIVSMIGEVMKYGDDCVYGADEIVNALRVANSNPNVIGTIFKIDGPGGAVSALGPFMEFMQEKNKPIVALVDHAMSLHYWTAAMVGDYIMAENTVTSKVGSIGVFVSIMDNRKAMELKGYKIHEIYADESPNKNEAFLLALEGKYEMIKKEMLSPTAQKFQEAVRKNRPNLKEEPGVLTGKTFNAEQALENGLIDGIGTMEQAILKLLLL